MVKTTELSAEDMAVHLSQVDGIRTEALLMLIQYIVADVQSQPRMWGKQGRAWKIRQPQLVEKLLIGLMKVTGGSSGDRKPWLKHILKILEKVGPHKDLQKLIELKTKINVDDPVQSYRINTIFGTCGQDFRNQFNALVKQ